jgi:hypothetical protein
MEARLCLDDPIVIVGGGNSHGALQRVAMAAPG